MKTLSIGRKTIVAAALAMIGTGAQANLVSNGSFENNSFASGTFTTYDLISSALAIPSWTISFGSIDLIKSYWTAADGNYSLDLSGNGPGAIYQTIATTPGQQYLLSFAMAGNPDQPGVKEAVVNVTFNNSTPAVFAFDSTGKTLSNMGWVTQTLNFIASNPVTTITFASNNNSAYGPALDNVSVTAVPEPETYAMMLAGLGVIGVIARRRKQSSQR